MADSSLLDLDDDVVAGVLDLWSKVETFKSDVAAARQLVQTAAATVQSIRNGDAAAKATLEAVLSVQDEFEAASVKVVAAIGLNLDEAQAAAQRVKDGLANPQSLLPDDLTALLGIISAFEE
jgi:hypothetical protein